MPGSSSDSLSLCRTFISVQHRLHVRANFIFQGLRLKQHGMRSPAHDREFGSVKNLSHFCAVFLWLSGNLFLEIFAECELFTEDLIPSLDASVRELN